MEHLSIYFTHGIRDIIPFCEFVRKARSEIEQRGLGQFLGDDMAIDGGDAEAIFSCRDPMSLFDYLADDLSKLSFMDGATVKFIFGDPESNAPLDEFRFEIGRTEGGAPNYSLKRTDQSLRD